LDTLISIAKEADMLTYQQHVAEIPGMSEYFSIAN
jgi:hypothetical protein